MLAEERHNQILAMVNEQGSVRVKDLSVKFGVTEDCIRKDLTQLEKKGLLKKAYGGAMKVRGAMRVRVAAHEYHVEDRIGKNMEAKRAIARKAMELIHEDDTVFLDISTSNIELARMLAEENRRITLVTNCIEVMLATNIPCSIRLIAVGGQVSERRGGFVGGLTNEQISRYRFDTAFMGVVGVDLDGDRVSTYIPDDGSTKALAIANSSRTYMMLETRKFLEDGVYWYGKVSQFTGAIMEKHPSPIIQDKLRDYPLDWRYAE